MINFRLVSLKSIGSSHQETFCKKGILKNFSKFIGKHLRWSRFFIKVADPRQQGLLLRGNSNSENGVEQTSNLH